METKVYQWLAYDPDSMAITQGPDTLILDEQRLVHLLKTADEIEKKWGVKVVIGEWAEVPR